MARFWIPRASLVSVAALLTSACVTVGTHDAVVRERDSLARESSRLSDEVQRLETANASLSSERVTLIDEMETIRAERDALRSEASSLQNLTDELSVTLEERESEVAAKRAEVDRLRDTYQGLVSDLESEVAAGQIQIEQLREGVRVNVSDEILFASGSAQLDQIGREVLDKVAQRLIGGDYRIEVEGHTDNIPIRGGLAQRYPTNWELAGARASRVVRLFQKAGVAGERMTAISYAEFRPVASNDTPEDRWSNRRIEIRLQPIVAPLEEEELPVDVEVGDGSSDASTPVESSSGT